MTDAATTLEREPLALTPGTELQVLARVVQRWPSWLMLVGPDRRVLARSAALAAEGARGSADADLGDAALACTQWVHSGGAERCCLDFGDALAATQTSILVQLDQPRGRARAVCARLEPIALAAGGSAWLVHLDPYGEALREDADAAWSEVIATRRAAGQEQAAWLAQLTQRWVQPLARPRWTGWLQEVGHGESTCRAASGRLARGMTQDEVCARAAAARTESDPALPMTLGVAHDYALMHLIPSGPAPGWVLALLGGHVDGARAAMLRGLVMAVAAADDGFGPKPTAFGGGPPPEALSTAGLTAREVQIVQLVAQGLPDKRIAQRLGLSFHTVRNHLRRIMFKLGVNTRAQIAFALAGQARPPASVAPCRR